MSHRNAISHLILAALLLIAFSGSLPGAAISYDDQSAWLSAASDLRTIDFEGIIAPGYQSYSTAAGLVVGDVRFLGVQSAAPGYELWLINPAAGSDNDWEAGAYIKGPLFATADPNRAIKAVLPDGVTAFSVELMTIDSDPMQFVVALSTGDQFTGITTAARPNSTFFGVTSDLPIAEVSFMLASGANLVSRPAIDNFVYGVAGAGNGGDGGEGGEGGPINPEETPEAATFLLVGTGLVLLYRARRRQPTLAH